MRGKRDSRRESQQHITAAFEFTLPERTSPATQAGSVISSPASPRSPYSKHRFVNANCRFVLSDYHESWLWNSERPVDWQSVLKVVLPSADSVCCCICLEAPPCAARVTQCGHVYCYPCLVHYLAMDQHKDAAASEINRDRLLRAHKKCPVCVEYITLPGTRSLEVFSVPAAPPSDPSDGSTTLLRMTLMKRAGTCPKLFLSPAGTTIALPKGTAYDSWAHTVTPNGEPDRGTSKGLPAFPPSAENSDCAPFAKIALATDTNSYRLGLLLQEQQAVRELVEEQGADVYLNFCLEELEQHVSLQLESRDQAEKNQEQKQSPSPATTPSKQKKRAGLHQSQKRSSRQHEPGKPLSPTRTSSSPSPPFSHSRSSISSTGKERHDWYFYLQASSGQPLFLNSLDVKILLAAYGSYHQFPERIDVPIKRVEWATWDEALKKRFKAFSLPVGTAVGFCQAVWDGIVPQETLDRFKSKWLVVALTISATEEITAREKLYIGRVKREEASRRGRGKGRASLPDALVSDFPSDQEQHIEVRDFLLSPGDDQNFPEISGSWKNTAAASPQSSSWGPSLLNFAHKAKSAASTPSKWGSAGPSSPRTLATDMAQDGDEQLIFASDDWSLDFAALDASRDFEDVFGLHEEAGFAAGGASAGQRKGKGGKRKDKGYVLVSNSGSRRGR